MLLSIQLLLGLATLAAAVSVLARGADPPPTAREAERSLGAPVRTLADECRDPARIP